MKTPEYESGSPWYQSSIRAMLRRAVPSGLSAGCLSAATAAAASADTSGSPLAPINAVTHCLWPQRALHERGFSLRHTVTGFAIHQAAAIFWATMFEALVDRMAGPAPSRRPGATALAAAATVASAYVVDYKVVPERLTPGFEAHLSRRSLANVYVALGAGLLAAALLRRPDR
ncbi:hypothetical protein BJG93_30925 (plasmid) [Paraburkholderia sprentiae WSM5005]|uniref:DUF2938 domain-containing protein n=1 Tax=Paraburkholderia sprentiae WSM5005 TaxID=754502 RepID=A0A1I9YVB8_9BURK|nr:hypothetical protein [Paraburkholderia sprentiae]APA90160.1 hypothetical protein BJG93_30925 [Paraburkholderia sprentiae WSM5005]